MSAHILASPNDEVAVIFYSTVRHSDSVSCLRWLYLMLGVLHLDGTSVICVWKCCCSACLPASMSARLHAICDYSAHSLYNGTNPSSSCYSLQNCAIFIVLLILESEHNTAAGFASVLLCCCFI
jgi:hypothetical protein